jgi:hypothetical protein
MKSFVLAAALFLSGCALFQTERERCAATLDAASQDLDAVEWRGFAGAVSHGKATALLVQGRLQQAFENFPGCIETAKSARFYVAESRRGR